MPLHAVAYVSDAVDGIETSDIDQILRAASGFNKVAGVTGVLMFDGRRFLQYFEGPEDGVDSVFQRVVQATLQLGDPRAIDVVAHRGLLPAEGHRQRQPDLAEPDDADARRSHGGNGLGHRSAPHRGTGPASRRGVIRGYVMRYGAGIQVMQA